jgi:hypothetical protein
MHCCFAFAMSCAAACLSGVASSIDADLENIQRLARFTGLLPKGLFVDNIVKEMKVGRSVERRRTL